MPKDFSKFRFLTLVMILCSAASVAAPLVSAEELVDQTQAKLLQEGPSSMVQFVRSQAMSGLDLAPLREKVLAENSGQVKKISVHVHPENVTMIAFANRQLLKSGIDFYEFEPLIDNSLPDPTEPFQETEASYNRWKKTRNFIAPLVGFGTTLIASTGILGGELAMPDKAKLIPAIAQGVVVYALELQFSHFSKQWNRHVWSKDGFPVMEEKLSPAEASRFKKKLTDLSNLLLRYLPQKANMGLSKINVKASYFYNYSVNFIYAGFVYAAGLGASHLFGIEWAQSGFVEIVKSNLAITTAFYFAFGLNQVLLGELVKRGEVSELRRFQIESTSFYLAAPSRILSLIPGYRQLGINLQLVAGAMLTIPNIFKLSMSNFYNAHTKAVFLRNQAQKTSLLSRAPVAQACQAALGKLYTAFPWVRRK